MSTAQLQDGYSQRATLLKEEVAAELGPSSNSYKLLYQSKRKPARLPWLWILSTLTFACTTAILLLRPSIISSQCPESRLMPKELGRVEIRFSGALTYDENGTLFNEHTPGEKLWVGEPSPEIDATWDSLEDVFYVLLDGDEADKVRDHTILENGYWLTGLDVFHQLHCLDTLRRGLHPEYYPIQASPRTERLHLDHCIDYLRQTLMCHGDASPVNHKWYPQSHRYGPDFSVVHNCKPFDELVQWSRLRNRAAREGTQGKEIAKDPLAVVMKEEDIHDHDHGHEHGH
ncbi:hypothetical protein F5Y19DRAFT_471501 [Xylariaceae sp. FL1651]|nr:hypothetical protein F5Y19DRAFT_471501 [Xylariaceae sp. FL1651]